MLSKAEDELEIYVQRLRDSPSDIDPEWLAAGDASGNLRTTEAGLFGQLGQIPA
jgi:hypothetical protein